MAKGGPISSSGPYRISVRTTEGIKTHDLVGDSFTFGRSSKADVKIVLDGISREHFKIAWRDGKFYLSDLKSSNGTVFQKKKLVAHQEVEYTPGEKVQVPGVKLQVWIEPKAAAVPAQAEASRIQNIAVLIEEEAEEETQKESQEEEIIQAAPVVQKIVPEPKSKVMERLDNNSDYQAIIAQAKAEAAILLQQAQQRQQAMLQSLDEKQQDLLNAQTALQSLQQEQENVIKQSQSQLQEINQRIEEEQQKAQQQQQQDLVEWQAQALKRQHEMEEKLASLALAHRQQLDEEKVRILEQARQEAKENTRQWQASEKAKLEDMLQQERSGIEERLAECQHWIQAEQQKMHQLRMDAMKEAQQMTDEAQRQIMQMQEKTQRSAQQFELEAKEKSALLLRQKELEARELLKEAEQKIYLLNKEHQLERQSLAQERARQDQLHQEKLSQTLRECEQLKRKAQDDADAVVAGAINAKELMQGHAAPETPMASAQHFHENQTRQALEQEWQGLLQKEYHHNRETIVQKITLEAREDSLKITGEAHAKAGQIVNEAYRQAGVILAEGQRKYESLVKDKETQLATQAQELQHLTQEIVVSRKTNDELKIHGQAMATDKMRLARELEDLQQQIVAQSTRLGRVVESLQDKVSLGELQSQKLKDEIVLLHQEKGQVVEQYNDKIFDLRNTITVLEAELAPLKTEKSAVETNFQQLRDEYQQLYTRHQTLTAKQEERSESMHQLTLSMNQLEMGLSDKSTQLASVEQQLEEKSTQLQQTIVEQQQRQLDMQSLTDRTTHEMDVLTETTTRAMNELTDSTTRAMNELTNSTTKAMHDLKAKTHAEVSEMKAKAQSELDQLLRQVAEIKANKEQYAVKEINQMKEKNRLELHMQSMEHKRQCEQEKRQSEQKARDIVDKAHQDAQAYVQQMTEKNRELFESVDMKEKEYQVLQIKMQQVRESKLKEAQAEADKLAGAQKKAREQEYAQMQQRWREEEARQLQKAQAEAQAIRNGAQSEVEQLKNDLKQKIGQIEQNAQALLQEETQKLRQELDKMRENQEKELTQHKVKELEAINQLVTQEHRRHDKHRRQHVQDIAHNIDNALRLKLKEIIPAGQEQVLLGMDKMIHTIAHDVLYPSNNGDKKLGVLVGSGKVSSGVKMFWIKVAASVAIPIFLISLHYIAPNFYPSIQNAFVAATSPKKTNADSMVAQQMEKIRNRPKFNPPKVDVLKDSFTESIIFSDSYKEMVQDPAFEKRWTIALSKFFFEDLGQSENLVVNVMGTESAIHKTLLPMTENINPDFADDAIARMKDVEADSMIKMKGHFSDPSIFTRYWTFKGEFYRQELAERQRAPAQAQ